MAGRNLCLGKLSIFAGSLMLTGKRSSATLRGLVGVLLLAVFLLLLLAPARHRGASAQVPSAERGNLSQFDDFPLWKDVPTTAFAVMGKGRVRGTRWAAFVFRGTPKREGAKRPCVQVAHISANGMYGYSSECGPLAPAQGSNVPPVYAFTGGSHRDRVGEPVVGESFIGMTFAPQVFNVQLGLSSGEHITRRTKVLSLRQSRKAHVRSFRYIALGLASDVCISHVTGLNAQGETVIDASTNECTEASG